MMRIALTALLLLLAAAPAAAQPADSTAFTGIAWGATADAVIARWGEPVRRGDGILGTMELQYLEERDGRTLQRSFIVQPSLGTIIAGYRTEFDDQEACRELLEAALRDVDAAFPELQWEARRPEGGPLCAGKTRRGETDGIDPRSGTRVSIRLNGDALVADAVSAAGWDWLRQSK